MTSEERELHGRIEAFAFDEGTPAIGFRDLRLQESSNFKISLPRGYGVFSKLASRSCTGVFCRQL